jgi:hypothetical protein
MQAIYTPLGAEGFELCFPVHDEDFDLFTYSIDGTPRQATWRPPSVRLVREDEGKKLAASDSPWHGSYVLILRRQAIDDLWPILRENGELLPLACPDAELHMFNPTRVLDALDEQASSIERFEDGRIMLIRRHVFRPALVRGVDIFKIPNPRAGSIFVSERVVQVWTSAGLRGLTFQRLWSG